MKVLEVNEKYLKFVGLLSRYEKMTVADKMLKYFTIFTYQFAFVYTCDFSAMYIVVNPGDVTGATSAFIMFLSALYGIVSLIGYIVNEENIKLLHRGLQEIVDGAESAAVRELYQTTEKKCQKITNVMVLILLRAYPCSIFLPTVFHGIFCMCVGNFDTSTWYFACAFEVPFDVSTIFGWWLRTFSFVLTACTFFSSILAIVPYFGNCCIYIRACCEHIRLIFNGCDEIISNDMNNYVAQTKMITGKLKKALLIHEKIMHFTDILESINSSTIFSYLLSNVVFFASAMYNLETGMKEVGIELFFCIGCISIGLMWPFYLWHSATHATFAVRDIAENVYSTNWYKYPSSVQNYILMIMAQSQIVIYISGFKMIPCTLEVFMKLNNTSVSYYMMFRSLSK